MYKRIINWVQSRPTSILIKLLSGFLMIGLALLVLVVIIIVTLENVGSHIHEIADSSQEVIVATSLQEDNNRIQDLTYQLLTTINNVPNATQVQMLLNNYDSGVAEVRSLISDGLQKIDKLNTNLITPVDRTNYKNLLQQPLTALLDNTQHLVTLLRSGQKAEALQTFSQLRSSSSQLQQILTSLRNLNTKLGQDIIQSNDSSQNAIKNADNTRSTTEITLLIVSLIIVLLAVGFGLVFTFTFSGPLEKLRVRLLGLAEGDLSSRLIVPNRDQFGQLASTFNQSIVRLGRLVEILQSQSVKVSSAAAEIAATSRQSAGVADEQAGSVSEVAVTVEELSNTAQQIADAATLVSQAAEEALTSADKGQGTLQKTITGINGLKTRVQEIAVKILALNERSQQVGHVVEQINNIAEEIHLLALNAAIESAAAGENGKRFGVVAARVKQLADKSRKATKDVQTVLTEIQEATAASVMATEQGMKEAERGVDLVHEVGDATATIIQSVERTVQLANAISLATQQQRSASEQVVSTMQQLTSTIQNNAASSKQSSTLAIELDTIANDLRHVSSQFKVDDSGDNSDNRGAGSNYSEAADGQNSVESIGSQLLKLA